MISLRCAAYNVQWQDASWSGGADAYRDGAAAQASEALCEHTRARLDEQMGLFQGHALHGCLQIPPGLSLPEVLRHFCEVLLLRGSLYSHATYEMPVAHAVQGCCAAAGCYNDMNAHVLF